VPDTPNLSSALGETVTQGRQFLAQVESLAGAISTQLEEQERAAKQSAGERQALKDEVERLRGQVDALNGTLTELRQTVHRIGQERDQVAADRDQARQAKEAAEREVAAAAADLTRHREQLAMVSKDRDALQADQIQWGLDREQLLGEQGRLRERVSSLEADLATQRTELEALQARHDELTEQANKAASDWATRRQALAAEIAAQNEEMEQVRRLMLESQERERRVGTAAQASPPVATASSEQSHTINSRLNTLVGFSSVLLDERSHALTA
jgi:chromosome segregation ATPase